MKLCWFESVSAESSTANGPLLGMVEGEEVRDISKILADLPQLTYPYPLGDPLIANLDRLRPQIEAETDGATYSIADVKFFSPVAAPSKIIGTPANYVKHVDEAEEDPEIPTHRFQGRVEEQGLFLKANSALVGPGQGVAVRFPDRRTDHEMELGVVIGKTASDISEDEALDYVAGYAIALDMVVRGPEDRSFRKSCDSYAVLGPWMVTADQISDPDNLNFSLSVNGEVRQKSNTKFMIINTRRQISWASKFYTLHPGDIIMTGTCEGVGPVVAGDSMECWIDGVGRMSVPVTAWET